MKLKGVVMEWLVIDIIYLQLKKSYMLTLQSSSLKMMAEAISKSAVHVGDVLYPVMDAEYLINKNKSKRLVFISASSFSATYWNHLKVSKKYQ
ncbi:polymyxin B resistance protein pmrD [Salmonella enterica subsp. enterica serovar Solt]|nr:polymyxin B resistance protein pmrD [Salmonella enterica subsp. enterica serovar Solt]